MGEFRFSWRIAVLALIAFVGIALSILAFWEARRADNRFVQNAIELRADFRTTEFQGKLQDVSVPVEALADFIATQKQLDLDEYNGFVTQARGDDPIARISWAPLVQSPDRPSFEAQARKTYGPSDYAILEPGADAGAGVATSLMPAAQRDEYLPILLQMRFDDLPALLGLDLFSRPVIHANVARARDTGTPISTLFTQVIAGPIASPRFVIFWPVYRNRLILNSVAERHAAFVGAVVASYSFDSLLDFSMRQTTGSAARISLFFDHPTDEPLGIPQAVWRPDLRHVELGSQPLAEPQPGGMRLIHTFDEFGRQWTMVFDYSPEVVAPLRSSAPQRYLGIGLILTVLLTAFVAREQRRRRVIEAEVDQRTRELHKTSDQLKSIIEATPLASGSTDAEGRITIWNRAAEQFFGLTAGEVIGTRYPLALPGREDEHAAIAERIWKGEVLRGAEITVRHKDGRDLIGSISAAAYHDASGVPLGIVFNIDDVTEDKRREAKERELTNRIRGIVETAADGIIMIDAHGAILMFNPAAEVLFGYSSDEVMGRNIKMLMPPHFADAHDGYLDNYRKTGDRKIIGIGREVVGLRKDGSTFVMHLAVGEIKEDGRSIYAGIVHDLTERDRHLAALQEMQTLLAGIVESSDDAIVSKTLDGIVTTWNRAAERIFGYSASEMIGSHIATLAVPGHEDDLIAVLERVRSGNRVEGYETQRRRKDGTIIDISLSVSPIRDARGTIVGASKIARDITAAKHAEKELRRQQELYHATFDQAAVGIALIDHEFRYVHANETLAAFSAVPASELIGRTVAEVVPDLWPSVEPIFRRALENGESILNLEGVGKVRATGDQIRYWQSSYQPVRIFGEIVGVSITVTDVTDRKTAEKRQKDLESQLLQAQKMEAVGQLTGGIAHDFNNILAVIIGNLDLLSLEVVDGTEARVLVDTAIVASLKGSELTKSLLAFSRRQPLQPRRVRLNELLRAGVNMLSRAIGETIQVTLELQEELWDVYADPAQIESALLNTMVNARDAMPNGGKIIVTTSNDRLDETYAAHNADVTVGDYAVLSVTDTGQGIPPEIMNRVFEPFFTTKGVGKGTGLGLAMVFGFAKQSGGHVKIYSEVGRGTTIRLYLPRVTKDEAESELPTSARIFSKPKGETILVVEDNPEVRKSVTKQLTGAGYRVLHAEDVAKAIDMLESGEKVDLVFSDVVMPGTMNGSDLAREVRRRWPETRFILTSGFPRGLLEEGGKLPDGIDLLGKPYRMDILFQKLREVLDA